MATGPAMTRVRSSTRRPDAGSGPAGWHLGGAAPISAPSTSPAAATAWPAALRSPLFLTVDRGGDPARADHAVLHLGRAQARDGRRDRLGITGRAEGPQQRVGVPR